MKAVNGDRVIIPALLFGDKYAVFRRFYFVFFVWKIKKPGFSGGTTREISLGGILTDVSKRVSK